jgi:PadR family transcriptional regulator
MIDELGRHGYRLSVGTLYPILHGMERQGYLRSPLADSSVRVVQVRRTGKGCLSYVVASEGEAAVIDPSV